MASQHAQYLGGERNTNVAEAQGLLFLEHLVFTVIVVSPDSTGVEKTIYDDLTRRHLRATSGPDEGIDTKSIQCYPNCVFIHPTAVNEIIVESWRNVLRHEQRHMVQAANNPDMARDFRNPSDKTFTTYAAFMEACADDGIYVADQLYHSSKRMPELNNTLGEENRALVTAACRGDPTLYQQLVTAYEAKAGADSFAKLFPPYR